MSDKISFVERLKEKHKNLLFKTDDENYSLWKQFVIDHLDLIKAKSEYTEFSEQTMYHLKYRLKNYLNRLGYNQDMIWIIYLLNNIDNETDFINLPGIYIPNYQYLKNLLKDFNSYILSYNKK